MNDVRCIAPTKAEEEGGGGRRQRPISGIIERNFLII